MENVILLNTGAEDKNFYKTIKNKVSLNDIQSYLTKEELIEIKKKSPDGKINIWGLKKNKDFLQIKVDDFAWFCSNNMYHSLTQVKIKLSKSNINLSKFLWGTESYAYIFIVSEINETNFTRKYVQEIVGLSAAYNRFSFYYLDDEKTKKLLLKLKLSDFVNHSNTSESDNKIIKKEDNIFEVSNEIDYLKTGSIRSIEEYIKEIKKIQDLHLNSKIFVYRGEKKDYGKTSCIPNIFRDQLYINNENYEISIYNDMYSKGIVPLQSSLNTAIDAQHGGFPSRLLDVSYNALIALYFATEFKEDEEVEGDAIVTVYNIDEIYIPGAHNSEGLFEQIIKPGSHFKNLHISSFNHKLIDHTNKNERIKAQQGAFILFQGREYRPIPEIMYKKIKIDKNAIKKIHTDLDKLFGINIGKIYPEPHNQIDLMKARNHFINNNEYSVENEFMIALKMFQRINKEKYHKLYEFIDKLNDLENNNTNYNKLVQEVNKFEESILAFKIDYEISIKQVYVKMDEKNNLMCKKLIDSFNSSVNNLYSQFKFSIDSTGIEISALCDFIIDDNILNIEEKK